MVSAPSLTLSSHAHLPPLYTLVVTSVPRSQPITVMLALCTPLRVAIKMRGHYLSARTTWLGGAHRVTLFSSRFFFTLVFSFSLLFRSFLNSFCFVSFPLSSCSFRILVQVSAFCFLFILVRNFHTLRYALRAVPSGTLSPFRYLRCVSLQIV